MNWTDEGIAERNQRVFGLCAPARDGEISVESRSALKAGGGSPSEALIEAECTKLLEEDGWRALRTDPVSDRGRGKGFGELGMADHLYIRYAEMGNALEFCKPADSRAETCIAALCQLLWIEFKSPKGKPKKHQLEWHTKERARGALTWIASVDFPATVEGFQAHYAASGLQRRAS